MKLQLIALFLLPAVTMNAQIVSDSFSSTSLTAQWLGNRNDFTITDGKLQSNNNMANHQYCISSNFALIGECEWLLNCRLLFNTSSNNYAEFWLFSDSINLNTSRNGYFLRCGSTSDDISLFKMTNGIEVKLIDGTDGFLNNSTNDFSIRIIRNPLTGFELHCVNTISSQLIREKPIVDSTFMELPGFCGLKIKQSTSSFFYKHFFDNVYAGPKLKDTIPPFLDSFTLYGDSLIQLNFSEELNQTIALNKSNFIVEPFNASVDSIGYSKRILHLKLLPALQDKQTYSLIIRNIQDTSGNVMPPDTIRFKHHKTYEPELYELIITEMMVDPDPVVGLPSVEYIEIYNRSKKLISTKGCAITDFSATKYFPEILIPPDSFIVLYSIPSLINSGKHIGILNPRSQCIHSVNYTDDWYWSSFKKDGGWSLEMIDTRYPCLGKENWTASVSPTGGSPRRINSVNNTIEDRIKPFLHSLYLMNDSVIRLNCNKNIDSNFLSAQTFQITDHSIQILRLNNNQNQLYLKIFPPLSRNVEAILHVGSFMDCTSNNSTPGEIPIEFSDSPLSGDLILNEILFNPVSGGNDYIEIYNCSDKTIDLKNVQLATMDSSGSIDQMYSLKPDGYNLAPNSYLLLSTDSVNVCRFHACQPGSLKINLNSFPTLADRSGRVAIATRTGELLDDMTYHENMHYSLLSSKEGVSLERLTCDSVNEQKKNWHSASSLSGYGTPGYQNSQRINEKQISEMFKLISSTISPDNDGFEDLLILEYKISSPGMLANISIYNMHGYLIKNLTNPALLSAEGILIWDGLNNNGQISQTGPYIMKLETTDAEGNRRNKKLAFTLTARF